jgi:hypothetical protein
MRLLTWCTLASFLSISLAARGVEDRKVAFVDLQPQSNQKLKDGLGSDGNNLAALPRGEQVFGGVKFKIDEGLIQLVSQRVADRPEKVEGLKVGTTFSKLHILHACHNSAREDAIIGYYTVHYEDKSQETIPIVYGKDILDWWYGGDSKEPTRGKVGWKGDNDDAKNNGAKIRLYVTTWKNPEPARKVVSVDFGSTNYTEAAPFCVAITAEE